VTNGGARARSGPPPDPNALRRERPSDKAEWTTLTAREGEAPPWPLARPTKRELILWASEWARPQALMWEHNGQAEEVAAYVRCLRRAEGFHSTAADWNVVLRLQTELGLNVGGLLRNRWIIAGDDEATTPTRAPSIPAGPSTRDRLKLVVAS
jgi:hypothetical protein